MENEVSEQAISHIRLTFPKRIFEVCYLMKRETEVEFVGTDVNGEYTKQIRLIKVNEEHISISLTVDNLTFEENNLCFHVDKAIAKCESDVQKCLEYPSTSSLNLNPSRNNYSNSNTSTDRDTHHDHTDTDTHGEHLSSLQTTNENQDKPSITVKRKRGRPRKEDKSNSQPPNESHSSQKVYEDASEKKTDDYIITPSGRKIRKPARFREIYQATDEAVKSVDPDVQLSGDSDADNDSEFKAGVDSEVEDDGESDADEDAELTETNNEEGGGGDNPLTGNATQSEPASAITVIKPRKKKLKKHRRYPTEASSLGKKAHAARGKKRPNYRREPNIECKICHNMYKDELSLIAHVQKLHPNDPNSKDYVTQLKEQAKVACKICGKVLGSKRNEMHSHMMRVHGKDDDFISKCDECGMEFKRTFLLKEHKRRQHPKHDRILCHLCPASFKLKEYLTEHLKYTHNKSYKWQCDICHKMTSSPKNLRRHKKLHEGALFQCPMCNKMFHESGNMRRHILYVHNAQTVTRHACTHCNRDFSTKNNLMQHINSVHMKTSAYYCDICKKYFECKKKLIEHATMMHPGVPILSTKMDENTNDATMLGQTQIHAVDDQEQTITLSGADMSAGQSTIIIQAADGTEHVLVPQNIDQLAGIGDVANTTDTHISNELAQAINAAISGQSTSTAPHITDNNSLSIAQQALAAFEAGGVLDSTDIGTEQYVMVGEDGQEIRVQIVRKPTDLSVQPLENIYVETAAASDVGLGMVASDVSQAQQHLLTTEQIAIASSDVNNEQLATDEIEEQLPASTDERSGGSKECQTVHELDSHGASVVISQPLSTDESHAEIQPNSHEIKQQGDARLPPAD